MWLFIGNSIGVNSWSWFLGALHIDGEQIPIKRIRSIDKLKENPSQRRPRKKIPYLYTKEVSALRDTLFRQILEILGV